MAAPIVVLCTGNAARSVMAGAALQARLPDRPVVTAGTLVVEGQPMSWRTRAALEAVGVPVPAHRSRQATARDLHDAALVIGLAPEHVAWVRRTAAPAADRTGTLRRLARDLPGPEAGALAARVAELDLADVEPAPWEEVVDPGGGDADDFLRCAQDIAVLVDALAPKLAGP